jgi:hypothetical protein
MRAQTAKSRGLENRALTPYFVNRIKWMMDSFTAVA